jgi:hypothetical protein
MTAERGGCSGVIRLGSTADQESVRAEDLFSKGGLRQKIIQRSSEELRIGGASRRVIPDRSRGGEVGLGGSLTRALLIVAGDAGSEKSERLRLRDQFFELGEEDRCFRLIGNKDDAGLGAELTRSEGE